MNSVFDNDVKYEVRGYTFPFTLYAVKPVLDFVYNNGIGYFSYKGFGMLDLAETETKPDPAVLTDTVAN